MRKILLALLFIAAAVAARADGLNGQTTIKLAPGLGNSASAANTSTQTVKNASTIYPQLFYLAVTSSCTINSTCASSATSTAGYLLTATAGGVIFTMPNPGSVGQAPQSFGFDYSHTYTITTTGGSASIYGCGASGTSVTLNYPATLVTDGTNYQCVPSAGSPLVSIANASSTGTTANTVTILTGGTAVIASTSTTSGVIGITVGGAGTSGNALIAQAGIVSCTFDSSGVTAGHYVIPSTVTGGDCADGGATAPTSADTVGFALATVGSGAANVLVSIRRAASSGGSAKFQFLFQPGTLPNSAGTTYYGIVNSANAANETFDQQPSAFACTAKSIYTMTGGIAPGSGNSWAFTFRDNASSTNMPTVTVSNSATTGSATGFTGAVSAGDLISLQIVTTGTPASNAVIRVSVECD